MVERGKNRTKTLFEDTIMLLKYFYDPMLSQASYMIACLGTHEALVVDPARHRVPNHRPENLLPCAGNSPQFFPYGSGCITSPAF